MKMFAFGLTLKSLMDMILFSFETGETSLHIAIVNGDLESVKLLVEQYKADVHARARGRFFMPEDYIKTQTKESNFKGK